MRIATVVTWALLLMAFWWGARQAGTGPLEFLIGTVDGFSRSNWAPAALLGFYLSRPLLLVPVTVLNLASGLLLGPVLGIPFALTGTLLSASSGYAIGRFLGSQQLVESLTARWPLVRLLRSRSFETVAAGGLMYLHADMVNLPAGLLRIRYRTFLLAIALGNSLTMTMAVLAGSSVDGSLASATIQFRLEYLALAGGLFVVSFALAYFLRRRLRTRADT